MTLGVLYWVHNFFEKEADIMFKHTYRTSTTFILGNEHLSAVIHIL